MNYDFYDCPRHMMFYKDMVKRRGDLTRVLKSLRKEPTAVRPFPLFLPSCLIHIIIADVLNLEDLDSICNFVYDINRCCHLFSTYVNDNKLGVDRRRRFIDRKLSEYGFYMGPLTKPQDPNLANVLKSVSENKGCYSEQFTNVQDAHVLTVLHPRLSEFEFDRFQMRCDTIIHDITDWGRQMLLHLEKFMDSDQSKVARHRIKQKLKCMYSQNRILHSFSTFDGFLRQVCCVLNKRANILYFYEHGMLNFNKIHERHWCS